SRLFLAFCLVTGTVNLTYVDLMSAGPFTRLFLGAWPFAPALLLHLAATFPERRRFAERWPRVVWVPYAVSAALMAWLQVLSLRRRAPRGVLAPPSPALAARARIAPPAGTARGGRPPLARRRARVLLWGFGIGYVAPLLGATFEVVSGPTVPYLHRLWELNAVFPAAMAYAIVRYRLFAVSAAGRPRPIYSAGAAPRCGASPPSTCPSPASSWRCRR